VAAFAAFAAPFWAVCWRPRAWPPLRAAAVRFARIGPVEVEQGLVGRVLGYGTVIAGDLEVPYVPDPRRVGRLAS